MVGCGDPTLGVTHPDLPPENQPATKTEGIYHNTWLRTRSVVASRSNSPPHSQSQEGKSDNEERSAQVHQKLKVPLSLGLPMSMQLEMRSVALSKYSKIKKS